MYLLRGGPKKRRCETRPLRCFTREYCAEPSLLHQRFSRFHDTQEYFDFDG